MTRSLKISLGTNGVVLLFSLITSIFYNFNLGFVFVISIAFTLALLGTLICNLILAGRYLFKKETKQAFLVIGITILTIVLSFLFLNGVPTPSV